MKRTVLLLALVAACRSAPPGTALTGAASPRAAVDAMLAAAKAQNLQAVSAVWGDEQGPARDRMDRRTVDQQMIVMICLLRHDQARVGEPISSERGRQAMMVELTLGPLKATSRFTTAMGPSDRWYVQDFETVPLQNAGFCRR